MKNMKKVLLPGALLLTLGASMPLATAASTPTLTQTSLSVNRTQSDLPITATLNVRSSENTTVEGMVVSVRDAQGKNYDFPYQGNFAAKTSGSTYKQTRTLPPGTYTLRGAYKMNGTWRDFPAQTINVWGIPNKKVVFPTVDSTREYPLTNQFNNSAWVAGHTSAYPGAVSGSTPQSNPGDHKSDCISPAWSAPTADGWFQAEKASTSNPCTNLKSSWKSDLITTRHADLSGFQARTGDTLTATVTIPQEQGSWPAIWTWSDDGSWNPPQGHGEVDLFEYHGDSWDHTLEHTNWNTAQRPNYCWNHEAFKPGVPFNLRVDFKSTNVEYFINGQKTCSLPGVDANWQGHLILSESVDAGTSGYHKAPASTTTKLQGFKVTDLAVWRP